MMLRMLHPAFPLRARIICALSLLLLAAVFARGAEQRLDLGWRFHRGEAKGADTTEFVYRDWRIVDLPHDWSIEDLPSGEGIVGPHDRATPDGSDVGYVRGGVGWYRRTLTDAERPAGTGLELIVEGAQQECDVWINGHHVAFQPHGYIPVRVEIGPWLKPRPGANVIAVRVVNPERNSRWYSGSGLYRGVVLRGHEAVHIPTWGARVDTLWVDRDRAAVQIGVAVENGGDQPSDMDVDVELAAPDGSVSRHSLGTLTVAPATTEHLSASLWLKDVQTWTPESPRLYQARFRLRQADRVVDDQVTHFGLRTIAVNARQGIMLNGQPIKLRGGCVHHDNGLLGARAFGDAERRRVHLLKESGFNAIRCAHNPPSTAFLDACDEEGMLVIDEFTDCWELTKRMNGYQRYFDAHADRDLATMLDRDFNHPSVIVWSIGNEIPERFNPRGVAIAERLATIVHREDPRRPVTAAINGIWEDPAFAGHWDANDAAFHPLDIGGYNYTWQESENDHARVPSRVMCGTESYPMEAWENWSAVERLPYLIGDFVWTAIDYLGESGLAHTGYVDATTVIPKVQDAEHAPWPVWNGWCGDLDIVGNKKPQSLYRDVVWRRSPLEILVHEPVPSGKKEKVGSWGWPAELPSWNWPGAEGKTLNVSVYTRARRVRLSLNGKLIGEQEVDATKGITARFDVPWTPGTLTATALDGENVVATEELRTTGPVARIRAEPESAAHRADRDALTFVPISLVDAAGALVTSADAELTATVNGPAELCAFGSGDPAAVGSVSDAKTKTFRGRALLILRSTGKSGTARVTVAAAGLHATALEIPIGAR